MFRRIPRPLLFAILFGAGLSAGILYGKIMLERQRVDLQSKIDKSDNKADLLQRRYTEQKAIAARLERIKLGLEGQKNRLQADIEDLKEEFMMLEDEKSLLRDEVEEAMNTLAVCEEGKNSLAARNTELKDELENERKLLAQTRIDYEERISKIDVENSEIVSELKRNLKIEEQELDSCKKKNATLCTIAGELLESYENKSFFESILEKEPFTQVKKVELEKFTQEFQREIEAQNIKKQD